jgi:hypothetical protein
MNIYPTALFAHVVGAIGTFVGVSIWLFATEALRRALRRALRLGQVRTLIGLIQPSGVVAVASIILLGIAGLYMAQTTWGVQAPWIVVATISFLLLAPFGAFVIDPRLRALAKLIALAPEGPLPPALVARTHDPLVGVGLYTYIGVLLGIVFLMTTKPPLATSILAMSVATVIGLATGLLLWWAARSNARMMLQVREPAG